MQTDQTRATRTREWRRRAGGEARRRGKGEAGSCAVPDDGTVDGKATESGSNPQNVFRIEGHVMYPSVVETGEERVMLWRTMQETREKKGPPSLSSTRDRMSVSQTEERVGERRDRGIMTDATSSEQRRET